QTGAVVAGTRVVTYDRTGKQTLLSEERDLLQTLVLSPQGDRLAASLGISSGQLNDIWIYDLRKNTKSKVTFDQHSFTPVWSPDGSKLVFDRVTNEGDELVVKDVVGGGSEEIVYKIPRSSNSKDGTSSTPQSVYTLAWAPDKKQIIFRKGES